MTRKLNNEDGNSLIELIMVMMLFAVFCLTTYTLIYSGSTAQQRISDNKDSQTDVRIAISYVNTKLRQNDESGKISIEKNPINGENAILIKNREEGEEYDTWIYSLNNTIYEFLGLPDEMPEEDLSIPIVQSEGLKYIISYDKNRNSVNNTIKYLYDGKENELSSVTKLRADLLK